MARCDPLQSAYGRHSSVDRQRSRLGQDMTEGVDEKRIRPSPIKPGRGGCRLVSRGGVDGRTMLDVV
jgi:hypothetical protein